MVHRIHWRHCLVCDDVFCGWSLCHCGCRIYVCSLSPDPLLLSAESLGRRHSISHLSPSQEIPITSRYKERYNPTHFPLIYRTCQILAPSNTASRGQPSKPMAIHPILQRAEKGGSIHHRPHYRNKRLQRLSSRNQETKVCLA